MDTRSIPEAPAETRRPRSTEGFEQTHHARAGRSFLARSLWWEQRLGELRTRTGDAPPIRPPRREPTTG